MTTLHKIIIGDSRIMKELADESVHLIVTSPPYWQLKDYGNGKQIGFNDTYEEYINNLNLVWEECHRVLHKGCRLCVNIGDQFARSVYYGRYKVIPIRTEIIKFCETAGFDYMGAIIWQKVTTCHTTGGATVMGSFPYPRSGILKLDYEFILILKKYGEAPTVSKEIKEQSKLTQEEWNQYFTGHWNFAGEKQDKHLAMFPEELPKRLIKMFSFVGDTVLDPFLGSGTTSLVAQKLHRNSIGYEINGSFLSVIKDKLGMGKTGINSEQRGERVDQTGMSNKQRVASRDKNLNSHCSLLTTESDVRFEIIRQKELGVDFAERIKRLPYIFKDPIKIDKKVDPKKLRFGSKIDSVQVKREDYYTVKEIISPEILILSNGLKIRLIGVKEKPDKNGEAVQFLREKTRGQRVFLKFDTIKYDDQNNLLCYLYLWNKTFLNAHLIKNGLVDVDNSVSYKYQPKFLYLRDSKRRK